MIANVIRVGRMALSIRLLEISADAISAATPGLKRQKHRSMERFERYAVRFPINENKPSDTVSDGLLLDRICFQTLMRALQCRFPRPVRRAECYPDHPC